MARGCRSFCFATFELGGGDLLRRQPCTFDGLCHVDFHEPMGARRQRAGRLRLQCFTGFKAVVPTAAVGGVK